MRIERARLCTLIPHAARMCLLDSVEWWDDETIVCRSQSHRDPLNPLRRDGHLSVAHALGYGVQAMAVHGGLLAQRDGSVPRADHLAALRDVKMCTVTLDDILTPVDIRSRRLLEPVAPGEILGTLNIRSHMAQVQIPYDMHFYNIIYQSSSNLNYTGTEIHSDYNGWIPNLNNAIRSRLLVL